MSGVGARLPSPQRSLFYACILLSGAVALTFQIVWQKYLSFLVGSEARSISLVVAVFLFGLATGYRFWGNVTERDLSRRTILKTVGYIELGIALYALIFPAWFSVVRDLAYAVPDRIAVDMVIPSLGVDLLLTGLLLFLPTFLMGASIPMLTAALPEHMDEVNYCHSRIYGINTLGAFAGAFIGGFYMLPTFGLPVSLALGAAANMVVGLVFVMNRLEGSAHKAEETPSIPNTFGAAGIYLFVFTTGAVSIAYEILFIRLLGLSIGSGHAVFPIILGVVILGLAIGSLSLRRGGVTAPRVMRELLVLAGLLTILYFTVPHWPYWLSHVRVSLTSIPSNYGVFLSIVVLFCCALLLPVVIPMGRLLPIGYSLIDKNSRDYGKVCGRIYFMNTMGTVVGAVIIAHALFHVLNLETIFKLNMALVMGLTAFLFFRHGSSRAGFVCALLAAGVFLLPQWNRQSHQLGLFRDDVVQSYHFGGIFSIPKQIEEESLLYFRDDPNTTVTVWTAEAGRGDDRMPSRSIIVNGKSDGNTIGDYSNMVLSGILPYLYAMGERDLRALVVGIGTGMTSGALAGAADVASVQTLEISPGVIEAAPLFDEGNFNLSQNPKSRLIEIDAFRFMARTGERFDIIASEPSNPWVVGVENLFTPEYYALASRVLTEGGVFFQWIQVYEIDNLLFAAIVENVVAEFPHVSLFVIGKNDVGLVASHRPLDAAHMERRLHDPFVRHALDPIGLQQRHEIELLEAFQTDQLRSIALTNTRPRHDLEYPWLGHAAGKTRFLGHGVSMGSLLPAELGRHLEWSPSRAEALTRQLEADEDLNRWCEPVASRHSADYICHLLKPLMQHARALGEPLETAKLRDQVTAHRSLRDTGFMPRDLDLLERMLSFTISETDAEKPRELRAAALLIVREFSAEREWTRASSAAEALRAAGVISEADVEQLQRHIATSRSLALQYLAAEQR